jgi:hypothetical protein
MYYSQKNGYRSRAIIIYKKEKKKNKKKKKKVYEQIA